MATTALVTAEEFLAMPTNGHSYELVNGELHEMMPGGGFHGYLHSEIGAEIRAFVKANRLGRCIGAETGFVIGHNPDTVRAPDFAFVTQEHWDSQVDTTGFLEGAPELIVEVVSPSDRMPEVREKVQQWLAAGTKAVWLVEPALKQISSFELGRSAVIYGQNDVLIGEPVLPGFRLDLRQLFE